MNRKKIPCNRNYTFDKKNNNDKASGHNESGDLSLDITFTIILYYAAGNSGAMIKIYNSVHKIMRGFDLGCVLYTKIYLFYANCTDYPSDRIRPFKHMIFNSLYRLLEND